MPVALPTVPPSASAALPVLPAKPAEAPRIRAHPSQAAIAAPVPLPAEPAPTRRRRAIRPTREAAPVSLPSARGPLPSAARPRSPVCLSACGRGGGSRCDEAGRRAGGRHPTERPSGNAGSRHRRRDPREALMPSGSRKRSGGAGCQPRSRGPTESAPATPLHWGTRMPRTCSRAAGELAGGTLRRGRRAMQAAGTAGETPARL